MTIFSMLLINSALKALKMKITEFKNREDPHEMAHYEPPHPDLHCLPSVKSLNSQHDNSFAGSNIFRILQTKVLQFYCVLELNPIALRMAKTP